MGLDAVVQRPQETRGEAALAMIPSEKTLRTINSIGPSRIVPVHFAFDANASLVTRTRFTRAGT